VDTLTMAARSLVRRKTRTLLVIVALTLALTLITILPPSINERQRLTQQTLEGMTGTVNYLKETVTLSATEIECAYPLSRQLVTYEKNGQLMVDLVEHRQLMNETLISKLALLPDIVDVVPTILDYATRDRLYNIYGVAVDNPAFQKDLSLLPKNITAGRNLRLGDSGVIIIDEHIAKNALVGDVVFDSKGDFDAFIAEWVAKKYVYNVGDSYEVLGHKFTIVGIEGGGFHYASQGVTMSLADAQLVLGKVGQVSSCKVFVNNADNVNSVVTRIKNLDSALEVSSGFTQLNAVQPLQDQINVLIRAAENNLSQIQRVGFIEVGVGVVAAVAVILFMMLYSVRERTREIGTLKAMGASTSRVLGQFMLEGVLLCVVAAIITVAISTFVLPQLSSLILPAPILEGVTVGGDANGTMGLVSTFTPVGSGFSIPGTVRVIGASLSVGWLVLSFGLAVLLGALGSLYPALKAARTKPAEAMRYE